MIKMLSVLMILSLILFAWFGYFYPIVDSYVFIAILLFTVLVFCIK